MNLQAVTIIFVIIFLPIILVTNFYIQREMDTISMQNSYDTKLIDATTDAISAFELNTANEDLSAIPDSLRSIVEASTNVFTTTLATNLGISSASKNKVLPYIPAIVCTLYDGYYIYSPTQQPKVLVNKDGVYVKVGDPGIKQDFTGSLTYTYDPDGTEVEKNNVDCGKMLYCTDENYDPYNNTPINCTTDPNNAYFVTNYILKSFIPYSMIYKNSNYEVTINYTLDNYISIKGTIGDIYYTKSGYLIDIDDIGDIKIGDYTKDASGDAFSTTNNASKVSLDNVDKIIEDVISNNSECYIFVNGIKIDAKDHSALTRNLQNTKNVSDNESAIKYYVKAYMFSCWVKNNLGALKENDIISSAKELQTGFDIKHSGFDLNKDAKLFWDYGTDKIFYTSTSTGTEEWNVNDTDSNFIEHKRKVIKNSIQYNLNLAMAVYNAGQGNEYYQMPILSDSEWDRLMSNVSILAFMQGLPCGLKTYNNYALITSTKNEIMTNINDIYYIPIDDQNSEHQGIYTDEEIRNEKMSGSAIDLDTAHKIDCIDSSWIEEVKVADYFQAFSAKDMKYDKVYNYLNEGSYEYDHVANECYYCIVNPNYSNTLKEAINEIKSNQKLDTNTEDNLKELNITSADEFVKKLVKAQLIADGKIKNNTFKSISATTNYGIDTYNYVDDSRPNGNTIFKDYYQNQLNSQPSNDMDKLVENPSGFNQILKDKKIEDCYEIDMFVSIENATTLLPNSKPYVYFKLGDEDATINGSKNRISSY